MDTYRTIEAPSEAKVVIKKSTFFGFAHPIDSEAEAESLIRDYRKRFYDARHVCYAYKVGSEETEVAKSSDNGEPSGTAGRPMMSAINNAGLTNVLLIVVRYFGGILLGTPGLIAAYREAASEAIAAASVITRTREQQATLIFDYAAMNSVMKLLKQHAARVISQQTDLRCTLIVSAPLSVMATLLPQLQKAGATIQ